MESISNIIANFPPPAPPQVDERALYTSAIGTKIIALGETEIAKVFTSKSKMSLEVEKLKFANEVNDLFVKFLRADFDEETEEHLLVMERLYPIELRAFELSRRRVFIEKLRLQLTELHERGFVFRDFYRTILSSGYNYAPNYSPNIIITFDGIRLIDTELSNLREDIGNRRFAEYVTGELQDLNSFTHTFLSQFLTGFVPMPPNF